MEINAAAPCRFKLGAGAPMRACASHLGCLAAAVALAGCAELLPKAETVVSNPWHSYEQAKAAIERIVPYQTTTLELKEGGFDPFVTQNVQLLNYSDIVLRFPISGSMPMDRLDRGLRECLEAGGKCTGYSVSVREVKHDRVGNFWLDALQFRRVVDITGWSFNAIVLAVDERVVYAIHGGQPALREKETNIQPLGIFQGWGDMLPGALR